MSQVVLQCMTHGFNHGLLADADGSKCVLYPIRGVQVVLAGFTEQVFAEFKVTKSNGKPYSRAAIADAIRKANKL